MVRGVLLGQITGDNSVEARLELARLNAITDRIDVEMIGRSVGPFEGIPEEYLLTPEQIAQDELLKTFENTGSVDIEQMLGATQADESAGTLGLRADVTQVTRGLADDILSNAESRQSTVIALASLAIGAALVIFVLATYSITSPLRSLTRQARHMATDRLPKAVQSVLDTPLGEDVVVPKVPRIKVRTRDEVADVAAALNTVQGSALDLAVEQAALRKNIADSFVNLGRRNQNLLDRQLDFITDLERQEQDAERLEGLFRLDHLATRMRRNAESLLRLAGGGDTTQAGWGGPVPVVDVVRGALGEVEDYQRVDVRALQPATVSGGTGADLAHILAELVENGLTFSPPARAGRGAGPAQRARLHAGHHRPGRRHERGAARDGQPPPRRPGVLHGGALPLPRPLRRRPPRRHPRHRDRADVDGRRRHHRPHRRAHSAPRRRRPPVSATSPSRCTSTSTSATTSARRRVPTSRSSRTCARSGRRWRPCPSRSSPSRRARAATSPRRRSTRGRGTGRRGPEGTARSAAPAAWLPAAPVPTGPRRPGAQPPQPPAPTAPPVLQTVGSAPATNGTSGGLTRRVRGANAPGHQRRRGVRWGRRSHPCQARQHCVGR